MKLASTLLVAVLMFVVFLIGCSSTATISPDETLTLNSPLTYPPGEMTNIATESAYPPPAPEYIPLDTPNPYPGKEVAEPSPDAFRLKKPIYAGEIAVRGTGPVGVPVLLLDLTRMGFFLGKTVIGDNGQFVFNLSSPLESGHRIGIALGNLDGTSWEPEDFYPHHYYGDEARQIPKIGFFYDTAMVKEKP